MEAEGIPAYVRGEALAGGIGELGVFGLVAVMVPEPAWPQARALVDELALGEPVSALDVSVQAQVINLLDRLQTEFELSYVFIAHDLSVMRYISDRIAVIHKGDIVELADDEELVNHAIHPYTRSMH